MCMIFAVFKCYLSSSEKGLKNSGMNVDLNSDLCNASAVLYQLSYLANLEMIIMWVDDRLFFCHCLSSAKRTTTILCIHFNQQLLYMKFIY